MHTVRRAPFAIAMLEAGADLHIRANDGATALHHATRGDSHHSDGVVTALARAGAELEARDGAGDTPLHRAVEAGNAGSIRALIEHGADVGATDEAGQTPLHRVHSARTARMLLDAGADPDAQDNEGCTPAKRMPRGSQVHATLRGASTLRSALSGEGDLDATDADGNTALHWAAAFGYVDVIAALLERGAEIDATNGWGQTPLLMAAGAGHAEATIALVDAGADPNVFGRGEFEYLAHRLRLAGCELPLFEPPAVEALSQSTRGLPRLINRIAHYALTAAAAKGARTVTAEHLEHAVAELQL